VTTDTINLFRSLEYPAGYCIEDTICTIRVTHCCELEVTMYRGRPLNLSRYVVCMVQGRNNILMKYINYIVGFILYLRVKTLKTRGVRVDQVVSVRSALRLRGYF